MDPGPADGHRWSRPAKPALLGTWRIVETELWDVDDLDLMESSFAVDSSSMTATTLGLPHAGATAWLVVGAGAYMISSAPVSSPAGHSGPPRPSRAP